jgi:hypothetical protein
MDILIAIIVVIISSYIIGVIIKIEQLYVLNSLGIYIFDGISKILFTPFTLLIIIPLYIIKFPHQADIIISFFKKYINKIGPVEFNKNIPKNLEDVEKIAKKEKTNINNEKNNTHSVEFYEELFTTNSNTLMVAQYFYAIIRKSKFQNISTFSMSDLLEWTYGKENYQKIKQHIPELPSYIKDMLFILIQSGAIKGSIEGNLNFDIGAIFRNILIDENASKAIMNLKEKGIDLEPKDWSYKN